jgi:hypothetical protein
MSLSELQRRNFIVNSCLENPNKIKSETVGLGRLRSKGPCDIPYKKSKRPPKFLQKAPFWIFCMEICKSSCD